MRFRARIGLHGKTATGIQVPPEVVENLGPSKRSPVRVTINGHTYRSTEIYLHTDLSDLARQVNKAHDHLTMLIKGL